MPKEGTDFGGTGEKDDFTSIEIALNVDEVVKISFSYIFASRELPEFGGTDYNDAFFLNINGENLAKLPDGKVCLFACFRLAGRIRTIACAHSARTASPHSPPHRAVSPPHARGATIQRRNANESLNRSAA